MHPNWEPAFTKNLLCLNRPKDVVLDPMLIKVRDTKKQLGRNESRLELPHGEFVKIEGLKPRDIGLELKTSE